MNPMRRTNSHSNVEVVMLLTLCTNFQVFAHFALQFLPMKLCFCLLCETISVEEFVHFHLYEAPKAHYFCFLLLIQSSAVQQK